MNYETVVTGRFLAWTLCWVLGHPFAAMSCKLKVNTVNGDVLILAVTPTETTVQNLKMKLLEQFVCAHPLERKILKVEVLNAQTAIDDAQASQTLVEAGLLHAEDADAEVSICYTRREVNAATKADFQTQSGFFQVRIPDATKEVSEEAFHRCQQVVSVFIPDSVTNIGVRAFGCCCSLVSVDIPDSVTEIGREAFSMCESFVSIAIPNSVMSIGEEAFRNCSSLVRVDIRPSVTKIGDGAFARCTKLRSIANPDSVTSIGQRAFQGCSSLESADIPDSVTDIGGEAFSMCASLVSIAIPQFSDEHWARGFQKL